MLEQAHDTKELNRVQRPLAAGGKLVDKPVDGFVTDGLSGVWLGKPDVLAAVERSQLAAHAVTTLLTGFPLCSASIPKVSSDVDIER